MLYTVPEIKEIYQNIDILLKWAKLNNIPFKLVSDFKILLTVNSMRGFKTYENLKRVCV